MPCEPNLGKDHEILNQELVVLRREMDQIQQERISHLETKIEELNKWVRNELFFCDERFEAKMMRNESHLVDLAAQKAVKQAFSHLGVDVDNPIDLQRFRDDLRFGGVFRTAASRSFLALVAALFGGIGFSIWMAFKDNVGLK